MERSCGNHACTRDSGDPRGRCAFFQTNGDGADDDLGAVDLLDGQLRNRGIDNNCCELNRILGRGQNQLALPRHRAPSRKTVRPQSMALGDFIHQRARPEALGHNLRFNFIRPMPMKLTSRLPGRENLQ